MNLSHPFWIQRPEPPAVEVRPEDPFGTCHPERAFRSLSENDTYSRSTRPINPSEPSRSPAGCPLRSSVGTSFGNLRSTTLVPKARPNASFRSFRRNPCWTVLQRAPSVPEAIPEAISPKAPFDTPSNQTLWSFLQNTPRVPNVKPKDSLRNMPHVPECPFGKIPPDVAEHATCPRVPNP